MLLTEHYERIIHRNTHLHSSQASSSLPISIYFLTQKKPNKKQTKKTKADREKMYIFFLSICCNNFSIVGRVGCLWCGG